MKAKTFEEISQIDDAEVIEIHVPEWDAIIYGRSISANDRSNLEHEYQRGKTKHPAEFRKSLLCRATCNKDGSDWITREQAGKLMQKSSRPVERIIDRLIEHNGLRQDMEELEKNYENGRSD